MSLKKIICGVEGTTKEIVFVQIKGSQCLGKRKRNRRDCRTI